MKSMATK